MTDRDRRIVENMPLVRVIIKKYFPNYTRDDDIFQIGCIGLIKSVDTYDFNRGSAFSTYAGRCI